MAFVGHFYAHLPQFSWIDWYPGDDYVDWFAVSVFGKPNVYMTRFAEMAREHHKGFMIAEAMPYGFGTAQGEVSWQDKYMQASSDLFRRLQKKEGGNDLFFIRTKKWRKW